MVGLPGFEPGSNGPKPSSIGQTNPQARECLGHPSRLYGVHANHFHSSLPTLWTTPCNSAIPIICSGEGSEIPSHWSV